MMKILIVDEDAINASKLKLVLSKYGGCEIASSGKLAVTQTRKALDSGQPFDLVTLDMDLKESSGRDVAEQIRVLEANKEKKTAIVMLVSEEAQKENADFLEEHDILYLLKPYSRNKLENILNSLGLEKSAGTPDSASAESSPKPSADSTPDVSEAKVKVILKKMASIVSHPERVEDADFLPVMEELVRNGGKQALLAVGKFISSAELPVKTRIAVIQLAGNIQSPLFLVPLNRIMDTEDNIKLAEAALMAIAKYGDQRALNVLNSALKKLKNPMLLNTIRREVAKIKDTNPVMAILPRFLQSYKNRKTFRNTVDILKKIVTPEHSSLFVNYLKSGNDVIEDGTFEILCSAGDPEIKAGIFNFFEDRIHKIENIDNKECGELYLIVSYLQQYLEQNPSLTDELILELKELYGKINDIRAKQILLSLLCKSQTSQALTFIKLVYNQEEELKEWIVEKLSGNQQAVDFLFEKYHAGQEVKEQVVKSLLKSEQGLQYFIKHFFTFELDKQELIIQNLTFTRQPFMMEFVRKVYQSNLYSLKCYLLHVLRDNYLFEFEDVLFAPENQREFTFMGNDYMDTICRLFPVTTIKSLFHKIAFEEISYTKVKKYLARIQKIAEVEPVISFKDVELVNKLFNKIVNANNVELNTQFFMAFENIKTLALQSYKYLLESTNTFINYRGAQINEKEKKAVNKFKQRLIEQFADIRESENIVKELNTVFANKPISREHLEKVLKTHHFAVSLNINKVIGYLLERIKKPEYISNDDRELFYVNFPIIGRFIEYFAASQKSTEGQEAKPISVMDQFASEFRIVISFYDKSIGALFKDQIRESLPKFKVQLDLPAEDINKKDIIICDVPVLKDYVEKKVIFGNRIYLYLENRVDYAQFREYKPKAFMEPISAHRVLKMMLKVLFLEE